MEIYNSVRGGASNEESEKKGIMITFMNFRDFGGYAAIDGRLLRKGLLYRSGNLDKVKGDALKIIRSLKLKTIIDLRSLKEYRNGTSAFIGAQTVTLPFEFNKITKERLKPFLFKKNAENNIIEVINSVYSDMVDLLLPQLGEVFRILLSADSYPVLINCRAGKDRTGFVCAVIQLALGVESSFIIRDYLKSNEFLLPKAQRVLKPLKFFTFGFFPTKNFQVAFTAQEKYIRTVIDKINNEYGGIIPYLKKCGIVKSDLETLKELFLEKP